MRLHRLRLVNFRLHADTAIEFGPGITAVVGPNGAGKTTLLEAIAWAFYGTPAVRGARDSIRRTDASGREPVRVEVDFSLGAHEYHLVRKLNGADLYQDGGGVPIANSSRSVTDRITAVLGMSRDEFFNTFFTGQKELAVMASMGATERGKFLSRLMGYERLRQAQDRCRARRSEIKAELTGVEHGLEDGKALAAARTAAAARLEEAGARLAALERVVAESSASLEQLAPRWAALQAAREQATALRAELALAQQQVDDARQSVERLNGELRGAEDAQVEADRLQPVLARADELQQEFATLDRAAESAGKRRDVTGQLRAITEQLAREERRLEALGDVQVAVTAAVRAKEAAEEEQEELVAREEKIRTAWVRDRQDAETKHFALQDQYLGVKKDRTRLQKAGAEGACPTCHRPLGAEFEAVLADLSVQLEEIESKGRFLKQRVAQLTGEPEDLRAIKRDQERARQALDDAVKAFIAAEARSKERADAERDHEELCQKKAALERELAALPDSFDVERHEALRQQLRELQPEVVRATELRVRAEHARDLRVQLTAAQGRQSERDQRLAEVRTAVDQLGFDEAEYVRIRDEHDQASRAVQEARLAVRECEGDVRVATLELESVASRLRDHEERVQRLGELRRDFSVHDELDGALDALRGDLNAHLRPDLSELASVFLSDLTDGRYHELELTEKYEVSIMEDGLPKSVISGGEEDIANLVLRLAISQMVSERAGQPLSLLVLDEIFGGLDEHRRQGVVDLLRGLSARFPQVILITHIEQIKQGVDRVLRVTVDDARRIAMVVEDETVVVEEHVAA